MKIETNTGCALTWLVAAAAITMSLAIAPGCAQQRIDTGKMYEVPGVIGPYNTEVLPDGDGLTKDLDPNEAGLHATNPWTFFGWVRPTDGIGRTTLIAGLGDPGEEYSRFLASDHGHLMLWLGDHAILANPSPDLLLNTWQFVAGSYDGSRFHLYENGEEVASGAHTTGDVSALLQLGPVSTSESSLSATTAVKRVMAHFGGSISLSFVSKALSADELHQLSAQPPDFSSINFEDASQHWPVQTAGHFGPVAPQDWSQMPHGKAPLQAPVPTPVATVRSALDAIDRNTWALADGWYMMPAAKVEATPAEIAQPDFRTTNWWRATVPGTALLTMMDRGVYPNPDYGLNNLAIPESLNRQSYWYRIEFNTPPPTESRYLTLTFQGINYAAQVWLNGSPLGSIKGAFIRGIFDVTGMLHRTSPNILAVLVSPPPHPGIPAEQSIKAGAGPNGGILAIDGPTFFATQGWDWTPAVRDRDTGIWQPVTLTATDAVKLGDPQVITRLPLPDTSSADVTIRIPLENAASIPVQAVVTASFENVVVHKSVALAPGLNQVSFTPQEFAQLKVSYPRLWWPNGYGKPDLYHLTLTIAVNGKLSDSRQLRFGIREISYELSVLDSTGHLHRVEYSPTAALSHQHALDQPVLDISHDAIRSIPSTDPVIPPSSDRSFDSLRLLAQQLGLPAGNKPAPPHAWVLSFSPGGDRSPAISASNDLQTAPFLVIKVNGVRIASRGGNWGLDDMMKRVSRSRLEPYFRLSREAHLNIIRNWTGENTEETLYDLADEYGLMVWNDFWESNQQHTLAADDTDLFLRNARDTILRFRNHPSIVVWCGRNEGVPQPTINLGLDQLVRELDGTRYYSPSSNQIELQKSGPYNYQDPVNYYTRLNRGFSIETGTESVPTIETLRSFLPKPDQWPVDDVWAYHDWVPSASNPFEKEIETEFGAPADLADFDRKAQMLNYVDHRAIFEGMNAHLWSPNSGRLLWMSQPAWPSTLWQIYSSDYDTQASYYGVMKACEPLHIQLDLSTDEIDAVNTTTTALHAVTISADVFALDNKLLLHEQKLLALDANTKVEVTKLDLAPILAASPVVFVRLQMKDALGHLISGNLYWLGASGPSMRALNELHDAQLTASSSLHVEGSSRQLYVHLKNEGDSWALQVKLTLLTQKHQRILPAYYSDNYISLAPGETRDITISYSSSSDIEQPQIALRGWNLIPRYVEMKTQSQTAASHASQTPSR